VGVRPEDLDVSRERREGGIGGIVAGVVSLPMMNATILSIRVGEHEVQAQTSGVETLRTGEHVWLSFTRYHVFDRESGARLSSHPETRFP
jgi:ABC-type sugar transport system ATPase subunit